MIGILGGGFGLYGYLPACVHAGYDKIALLDRYKNFVTSRAELKLYVDEIIWFNDETNLIKSVDTLILARRPVDNLLVLRNLIKDHVKVNLIVEKPPAPTIEEAISIFSELSKKRYNFRIPFIFIYTRWFKTLENSIKQYQSMQELNIVWKFRAHHIVNEIDTWKRFHSEGGGVLRFYAIHIIGILAKIGWNKSKQTNMYYSLENEPTTLKFSCEGGGLPSIEVEVTCDSEETVFKVETLKKGIYSYEVLANPFEDNVSRKSNSCDDVRVGYLTELLKDLSTNSVNWCWYSDFIKLWRSIENAAINHD